MLAHATIALAVTWFLCHSLGVHILAPILGSHEVGGSPRWRSAVGLITSCFALPSLMGLGLYHAGSFSHWCNAVVVEGLGPYDWAFVLVFAGLMLVDLAQGTMLTALLKVHHVTCLCGHAYACLYAVAGFPYYFAGVASLELGSAATGVHALWPRSFPSSALVACMTLSNLSAVYCCSLWHLEHVVPFPAGARVSSAIIVLLAFMRQKDAMEVHAAASK